ncbi:glutathione S-transferase family protein [Phenylobacterium sp. J367]|uniref:glutathione S-transferase family protein n=1 Tax=Phenylobacterium sp. J367 TaxID=2898435 RepID=UPI002151EC23|nr:glutathione S-transferase family protein [Phenylobacterium sp. J367]MCR5877679.1 glutathione S-transferase [Phenylobacterium sp. J367]
MTDYHLYGGLGSPYSMKMRAVMRYRRLPHRWIQASLPGQMEALFARVKAPVIPVLVFPDGEVMNDSTPLIRELERRHPERSVRPADPGDAFLADLLEDMADEWGTKAMFLYRWLRPRDQAQMAEWLAYDRLKGQGREVIGRAAAVFRDRQVGRMALVGCTPENASVIEATTERIYGLLDAMAADGPFLFGTRPSHADFAWYGQLSQLGTDPTPHDLMRETAPLLMRWLLTIDDASGVEGEWRDPLQPFSPAVAGLVRLAGEVYLPFLKANADAIARGDDSFSLTLLGRPYSQGVFRYQAKCLAELRDAYARLPAEAAARIDPLLETTGARAFLA